MEQHYYIIYGWTELFIGGFYYRSLTPDIIASFLSR